jgi:Ni/Co efflux regulator RcnB
MKRIAFVTALLLAGTAIATAQPGAGYQDRGNREQSVGVHDNKDANGTRHHAKRHKAKTHHVASRSGHRTTGRGLPPGGKYQNQKENESEGKTPDGRM